LFALRGRGYHCPVRPEFIASSPNAFSVSEYSSWSDTCSAFVELSRSLDSCRLAFTTSRHTSSTVNTLGFVPVEREARFALFAEQVVGFIEELAAGDFSRGDASIELRNEAVIACDTVVLGDSVSTFFNFSNVFASSLGVYVVGSYTFWT